VTEGFNICNALGQSAAAGMTLKPFNGCFHIKAKDFPSTS
jgi:hypothetical protein